MLKSKNRKWLRLAGVALATSVGLSALQPLAAQESENSFLEQIETAVGGALDTSNSEIVVQVAGDEAEVPKVWVGVMLKEIEGDLAEYLGDVKGVMIGEVMDDSPASKAGVKKGDVLVGVDGENVKTTAKLMKLLGNAKAGKTIKMKFLRNGKKMELDVKPAKRPQQFNAGAGAIFFPKDIEKLDLKIGEAGEMGEVMKLLRRLEAGEEDVNVFSFGGPSFQLKSGGNAKSNSNSVIKKMVNGKSMEVRVEVEDGVPQITVTKDGKTTKYDDFDDLPEDVNVIVKPMVGGKTPHIEVHSTPMMLQAIGKDLDGEEISKTILEALRKQGLDVKGHKIAIEAAEKAHEAAEKARVQIRKRIGGGEIEELRDLVDELRAEVKELRKQLRDQDDDSE
ncbi:MAG: PDZ domain-containing protein [Planctomycetota bacterium]